MGNTWGISGPHFLAIYGALLVAASVFALVWRRHPLRSGVDTRLDDLHPVELAYLRDGPDLAVLVAYWCLYRRGRLVVDGLPVAGGDRGPFRLTRDQLLRLERGRVTLAGVRGGGHPLEDALASSIAAGDSHHLRLARLRTSPEMEAIEAKLTARGLLVDRARVVRVRRGAIPLAAVLVLGIARLAAGIGRAGLPSPPARGAGRARRGPGRAAAVAQRRGAPAARLPARGRRCGGRRPGPQAGPCGGARAAGRGCDPGLRRAVPRVGPPPCPARHAPALRRGPLPSRPPP
jgi:uncharacterized protein (TIGR04222 family)